MDRIWGYALKVLDGDTFVLDVDSKSRSNGHRYNDVERVRLRAVDAPERGQAGAAAATARLRRRVTGRRVGVVVHSRDVYGRLIGEVVDT